MPPPRDRPGRGGRGDTRRHLPGLVGLLTACLLVGLLVPTVASAQVGPRPTDGLLLPDRSVTTQTDAASIDRNPAGLGFVESAELRYSNHLDGDFPEGLRHQHGAYFGAGNSWIAAGGAIQWLDRPIDGGDSTNYQKYSFGFALSPSDSLSVGVATHLFGSRTHRPLDGTLTVDVGTQWHLSRHVGVGLALRDVNQPFLTTGAGQPLRILPGAAFRLLDERVELDTTLAWSVGDGELGVRPRLRVTPTEGLDIFARAEVPVAGPDSGPSGPEFSLTGGMAVSLGHVGLQAAGQYIGGDSNGESFGGTAQSLWYSFRKRESLFDPPGTWVRVDLDGDIAERASSGLFMPTRRSLLDVLLGLRQVSHAAGVDGVVLDVGNTSLGWAQAWELRQAVDRARDRGKKVVAYLGNSSFKGAYLASAADRIVLSPAEPFEPGGLSTSTLSYGDALARAGIEAEFVRIGEYKSSPERFTRSSPSEPALQQTEAYVDALFEHVVEAIADDRDLTAEKVRRAIDEIPLLPDEAVERGVADGVAYPKELELKLRRELGASSLQSLSQFVDKRTRRWSGGPHVAVVYIDGSIVQGQSGRTPLVDELLTGSKTIRDTLDRLAGDPEVKAVVLRVDTPGGSAVASDTIYRAVRRLAQQKPVVTSMGDVAASGGDYVAAGADQIVATPTTLTGSIGIYAGKFSLEHLFDRVGIEHTEIQRGKRADQFDFYEPWSDEQRARISRSIHYMYRLFLEQAAKTRPLDPQKIDEIGRGRVWAGGAARARKLVDHRGGLMDAIRRAEDLAGLPSGRATYKSYPSDSSVMPVPTGGLQFVRKWLGESKAELDPRRRAALGRTIEKLLGPFADALVVPLAYEPGEVLMLPPAMLPTTIP